MLSKHDLVSLLGSSKNNSSEAERNYDSMFIALLAPEKSCSEAKSLLRTTVLRRGTPSEQSF